MCRYHRSEEDFLYNPTQCPFTIRRINGSTWLVRENDRFGEYPHVYVKKCTHIDDEGEQSTVLVINDTGVGTDIVQQQSKDQRWNISSFIEEHLNPERKIPYLVILSHCHYDHILGLNFLLPELQSPAILPGRSSPIPDAKVLSSSHARTFLEPYDVLMEHSLCASEGLDAPAYQTSIWAGDDQQLVYKHPEELEMQLPIITFHTPGHTPDSLSWYDTEERVLYVGDSFYAPESADTRRAPWGSEKPAAILFPNEGDIVAWWHSLDRLLQFVKARNDEKGKRVTLAAGHVTASSPTDAEACMRDVKMFMAKILHGEIAFEELPRKRGQRYGLWRGRAGGGHGYRCSLGAPLCVVEKGREKLEADI